MANSDLFKNYILQREELLARIAQTLQLDDTKKARMESAYGSISSLLNNDQLFFKHMEIDVYPQGSVATGTTTKPLHGFEFDLDIVIHIKKLFTNFSPSQIYNEVVKILERDGRYKDKIQKKKRCVRLNYADDFHMDIMPGCIKFVIGNNNIKVPDRELKNWVDSNPRDFIEWFLNKCKIAKTSLLEEYRGELRSLKAEVEDLPNDDFYNKTPLQRAVQLIKRYRDLYFEKDDTYATSSVVLTTLMGQFYNGENSIYDTLENTIQRIKQGYQNTVSINQKFKILNPVNQEEDFTDKWTSNHYIHFINFIQDFYQKWNHLKENFDKSANNYILLFGESIYKQSLQDQLRQMSKFSKDINAITSGLIISGSAFTNKSGQLNSNNGYKNEHHHSFGE